MRVYYSSREEFLYAREEKILGRSSLPEKKKTSESLLLKIVEIVYSEEEEGG